MIRHCRQRSRSEREPHKQHGGDGLVAATTSTARAVPYHRTLTVVENVLLHDVGQVIGRKLHFFLCQDLALPGARRRSAAHAECQSQKGGEDALCHCHGASASLTVPTLTSS